VLEQSNSHSCSPRPLRRFREFVIGSMAAITNSGDPRDGGNQMKPPLLATRITFDANATIPEPNVKKVISKRKFAPRMTRSEYKNLVKGRRQAALQELVKEAPARLLDGFLLLEACKAEFPDEAHRAELQEMGLTGSTSEDLKFFTNMVYMDVGDNQMSLEDFGAFPALEELHLHCNMIKKIGLLKGFDCLEVLDLSYNKVGKDAFRNLMTLPRLRVLDLTCNSLNALPSMLADFRTLEVLSLERNRLEREETLLALSSCPNLRELNLAHNFFRGVPASIVGSTTRGGAGGFRMLEWLNLAHNYISNEDDVVSLVECPRLMQVILYGNPLTAPGSFDAENAPSTAGTSRGRGNVSASVRAEIQSAAAASRMSSSRISTPLPLPLLEKAAHDGRVMNFVTEPPNTKRRAPARGAYSSFKITTIKESIIPSNAQWKEAGNRALFDENTWENAEEPPSTSIRLGEDEKEMIMERQREAAEKELEEKSAAHLKAPSGLFMTEADIGDDDGEGKDYDGYGDEFETDVFQQMEDEGMDELIMPGNLLQGSIVINDDGPGEPAALRTAISNLRYALKHPVVADDNFDKPAHYMQHTTATKSQVKPRIPYKGRKTSRTRRQASPKGARHQGSGGVSSTNPALANIEYVLDRMNARVSEVENDLGLAEEGDKTMASLIQMVNGVMQSYESNGAGDDK
jgi:hypothetical protein